MTRRKRKKNTSPGTPQPERSALELIFLQGKGLGSGDESPALKAGVTSQWLGNLDAVMGHRAAKQIHLKLPSGAFAPKL